MTRVRRRGRLLNAGLVLLLAVAGGVTWFVLRGGQESNAEASARTIAVESGVVDKTVSAAGNIEAASRTETGFTTSGTLTKVPVQVGAKVKKGQVLGTIDPKDAEEALADAEYAREQAAADVESAKAGLTVAQASVTDAETAKESWENGDGSTSTGTTGTAGGQDQSQAQSEESLDAAIEKAGADVTSAEVQVKRAERDLANAEQDVADAKQAVAETTLRAPVAGTVIEVNGAVGDEMPGSSGSTSSSATSSSTSSSSDSSNPASGDDSSANQPSDSGDSSSTGSGTAFVVIADLDKLVVTANYTEADVVDLKVGQTATVTPNAQSDKTFTAKVSSISPTATVTSNVVTYPVTLTLDDTGTGLRDGQTVSAKVLVDQAEDVLRLPASAVRGTGDRGTVTLVRAGVQQTVTVEVGLRGDQYLQITSGLSAGDQVVLASMTGNSSQQGGTAPGGQFGGQLPGSRQVPDGNGGGFR